MNQTQPQLQITPYAMLAAILFNLDKVESVRIKPDDASEEVEVKSHCVGIESTEDALVCLISLDKILHFAQNAYDFQFKIDDGHAVISFEKHVYTGADLYSATGTKVPRESPVVKELLERFK